MNIAIRRRDEVRQAAGLSIDQPAAGWQPAVRSRAESTAKIAFVVNGGYDSAMGQRAREFAGRIAEYDIHLAYRSSRKVVSIFAFIWFLLRTHPAVTNVFDISYSGVLAAALYRIIFANRMIVDTGDAITELARSTGERGKFGLWLTRLLENFALRVADRVVVRGSFHRELLSHRGIAAEVIQDGVDVREFTNQDGGALRTQHGLKDVLTIGLVGSSVWSEKLQMCYGWELVETIALLKDEPVKGIMIGDGSGISHLKARCRELGIEDKILFLGHLPYNQLPRHLNMIDVCLSTQTNDVAGQVRTTGKLPLYLASGRFILASNVGEAALVLNEEMLVDYDGVKDEQYPAKLAARIELLLDNPELFSKAAANVAIAQKQFDYSVLAQRAERVIAETLKQVPQTFGL
jgi:glycosyltransferase involved in cell wall biosynthesis